MDSHNGLCQKQKVLFIMGTTGSGKSKLSIDLATQFPAEIINSDKMQVYKGLDIVTNKTPEAEQLGIPHHLFGVLDPNAECTVSDFRHLVSQALESIVARNRLPIIVGGSNNYIEALVDDEEFEFRSKYECCFIWLYVSLDVLHPFVSKRVDKMVDAGLVDEIRNVFDINADYEHGVKRSIGVPEFDLYFRLEPTVDEEVGKKLLELAIEETKINTCKLACNQLEKIHRLKNLPGWNIHCIDATNVFCEHGARAAEVWEILVMQPCTMIVEQFLYNDRNSSTTIATTKPPMVPVTRGATLTAATH